MSLCQKCLHPMAAHCEDGCTNQLCFCKEIRDTDGEEAFTENGMCSICLHNRSSHDYLGCLKSLCNCKVRRVASTSPRDLGNLGDSSPIRMTSMSLEVDDELEDLTVLKQRTPPPWHPQPSRFERIDKPPQVLVSTKPRVQIEGRVRTELILAKRSIISSIRNLENAYKLLTDSTLVNQDEDPLWGEFWEVAALLKDTSSWEE